MKRSRQLPTLGATLVALAGFSMPLSGSAEQAVSCAGQVATMVGSPGDDVIVGTAGNDVIHGLAGDDVIRGRQGNDIVCGGTGRDTLEGGNGADALYGGTDRDILIGGFGPDILRGGAGIDWVRYTYRGTGGVAVSLVTNTAGPNVAGGLDAADTDSLADIENVIGSDGDDILVGNDGRNILRGRSGDDQLIPLRKGDEIDGGDGFDWVQYFPNNRAVTVNLKTGRASGSGQDQLSAIEAVWGTDFDDVLAGDSADNYLFGAAGDDQLFGKVGIDRLEPGPGVDVLNGGVGEDWAVYQFEANAVAVDLAAGTASGSGTDTLVDVESVIGSDKADLLFGDSGSNYLIGGAGNDELRGRGGPDNLDPGTGNDVVRGGADSDWVYYWTHTRAVSIDLQAGAATGSGSDQLISIEAAVGTDHDDLIFGDGRSNSLWGFGGDDEVRGRGGDDFIQAGGGGSNRLIGGSGHDIIRFNLFEGPIDLDLRDRQSTINGLDRLFSIEGAWGTDRADKITGTDGSNTLLGLSGNDVLNGLAGDDLLDGGLGTDTANGGAGSDTCLNAENVLGCEQLQEPTLSAVITAAPRPAMRLSRTPLGATWLTRLFGQPVRPISEAAEEGRASVANDLFWHREPAQRLEML